ncbi:MAG: DUF5990 family protein [Acidimicrobiales bacterium]
MANERRSDVRVHLHAVDPPFWPESPIEFGLQDKRGHVDPVPATSTSTFEFQIEVVPTDGGAVDFRGDVVSGKRGDRFVYLSWGASNGIEPFVMFARAKIMLSDLPAELLAVALDDGTDLECRLAATNKKGQPASGTIRPPALSWALIEPGRS